MSILTPTARGEDEYTTTHQPKPNGAEAATGDEPRRQPSSWLVGLRVATGFIFLWAFLDKLFGFGYATQSENAWINGGSPTEGFLSGVAVGPLESTFNSWAGDLWADWLFMVGLAAIGVAVTLGICLRIAAVSGATMMLLMWAADWPLAEFTSAGEPTRSTNPLVDYHIIYAVALVVLAVTQAGDRWGLGRLWGRLSFVQRHRALLQ